MVKGLDKFEEYFEDFSENYILIGGAACDTLIENAGLNFRTTKDLDIILVVEKLSPEFVKKFWKFIIEGEYKNREESSGDRKYYRFTNPKSDGFPYQIELFSRNPDLELGEETHLTPIPIDEEISSLSAILLDEDYYNFILNNSIIIDGLHLATTCGLICLKARAYISLKERKESGERIDSNDIKKHRLDIVRLGAILTDEDIEDLPESMADDLKIIIEDLREDLPDGRIIGKNLNADNLDIEQILQQIEITFHLE